MRIVIGVACLCLSSSAYAAVPCHTGKDGDGYWSWREIDGRRCWYRGSPGKPKAELFWKVAAKPTSSPPSLPTSSKPTPSPKPQVPVSYPVHNLHVTPATPSPAADVLRVRPMTEGVLIDTPGAVIEDAVPPKADGCCWPPLEQLPFAERWSGVPKSFAKEAQDRAR